MPRKLGGFGERLAKDEVSRYDEQQLVETVDLDRFVGRVPEEENAVAHATNGSPRRRDAECSQQPCRLVAGKASRRLRERSQRVQIHVLMDEDDVVVTGERRTVVQCGSGGGEPSARIVDRQVLDCGLVAMLF